MKADELKALVDPAVATLAKLVGSRGSVIIMVSSPDGDHDSYYVNWAGPCLTAKGLREQGNQELQKLIQFVEKI